MGPTRGIKEKRGLRTVTTIARKGVAIARNGAVIIFTVLRKLYWCAQVYTLAAWLNDLAENGDAASSVHTVLTAIVAVGKILIGVAN